MTEGLRHTVLLLGNLRASLTLARTLSRAGHRIIAGVDGADPYLFLSRHVDGWFRHAPLDAAPEAALQSILPALSEHGVDVVLPVSEVATRLVADRHTLFADQARIAAPAPDLVARCADKAGLFDLCDQAGAPIAARAVVGSVAELHAAAAEIGGALVVKPTNSTHYVLDRKALRFEGPSQLIEQIQAWPAGHETLCVQRYVAGPRKNIYFAAERGRLQGAVAVQVTRTDTLDGTGYAVAGRSVSAEPGLRQAVERLIGALEYHGVGCAQFMTDGDTLSFLEINPRLGANFKIVEACGLALSRYALALPLGEAVPQPIDPWGYRTGVRYAWTKGALTGVLNARREHGLGAASLAGLLAQTAREAAAPCHLTFDLRDPLPTLGLYANKLIGARFETDAGAELAGI